MQAEEKIETHKDTIYITSQRKKDGATDKLRTKAQRTQTFYKKLRNKIINVSKA